MRRRSVLTLAALVAAGLSRAHATQPPPALDVVGGQLLVRFAPGTPEALKGVAHARAGARLVRRTGSIGWDLVSLPALASDAVAKVYRALPGVQAVEPNLAGSVALAPGDACAAACDGVPGQWHLQMTNAPFGWDAFPGRTFTASEMRPLVRVTIAVLDTRIDRAHPDWRNAGGSSGDAAEGGQLDLANARDWVTRHTGAATYHGTFVAGLAAAAAGNARDVAGTGFVATVMPLAVVNGDGNTDAAALADAIVYARERGARVINLSLGISGDSGAVHDAIRWATARGALVVAAAGNNTGSTPFYPGSYPEVMSVSGTDRHDRPAPCSNHNANVSVSAPADRLVGLAPMPTERLQAACGTSAAAPQVSSLAALLFAQDPNRTAAEVRRIIESTADDLGEPGRDARFGSGRINVERALRAGAARTSAPRATVVAASGGTSIVTASVAAPRGARAAQVVFDRPDATPVAAQPVDGAWGGTTEGVRASVRIPSGLTPGPHPVWVRASDGTGWGAAAVTWVGIDARGPAISNARAQTGVRATGQPLTVTFSLADDYATTLAYGVEFYLTATGQLVHRDIRASVPFGAQSYRWLPGLSAPGGHYSVKVIAADGVGNSSATMLGAVLT